MLFSSLLLLASTAATSSFVSAAAVTTTAAQTLLLFNSLGHVSYCPRKPLSLSLRPVPLRTRLLLRHVKPQRQLGPLGRVQCFYTSTCTWSSWSYYWTTVSSTQTDCRCTSDHRNMQSKTLDTYNNYYSSSGGYNTPTYVTVTKTATAKAVNIFSAICTYLVPMNYPNVTAPTITETAAVIDTLMFLSLSC